VFSAVGLAAAFLTAICWFPWLDGGEPRAPASPLAPRQPGALAALAGARPVGLFLGVVVLLSWAGAAATALPTTTCASCSPRRRR
jgi:predicted exporter